MSQSPSLRGSGRFATLAVWRAWAEAGLNPLHCGAVVASAVRLALAWRSRVCLNPLHCGAVVASTIAPFFLLDGSESQSPSLRGSGRFELGMTINADKTEGLNPLHCGAVVASGSRISEAS